MLDPIVTAGIISGGASLLGGAISHNQAGNLNATNRQFSHDEAQLSRDFQSSQGDKQYARQLSLINSQRQYDSPAAYMARLKAAGLNPNLAYQNIPNLPASNVPSIPSASMAFSPSSYFSPSVSEQTASDISNTAATLADTQAEVKKKTQETEILTSNAKFADAFNTAHLTTEFMNINLTKAETELKKEFVSKARAETAYVNQQCQALIRNMELISEHIQNVKADTFLKRLEYAYNQDSYKLRLKQLSENINLTVAQAQQAIKNTVSQCLLNDQLIDESLSRSMLYDAQKAYATEAGITLPYIRGHWQVQNNSVQFDLDLKKELRPYTKWMNGAGAVIGQAASILFDVGTTALLGVKGLKMLKPSQPLQHWSF